MTLVNWARKTTQFGVLLSTAAMAALAIAPNASAQTNADGRPPAPASNDEVVVTGTRIKQPNLVGLSPVQAVSALEIAQQGTLEASDILNNLPQVFTVGGIDFTNAPNPLSGPGGTTTVNLRGLGPQRTLVLVDGVRLGAGDSNAGNPNPGPDLDQIPGVLVNRVDVVTGGASAVYGSDAVAGVVNFILKQDFSGLQIDGRYGFATHTNDDDRIQGIVRAAGLPIPGRHVQDGDNNDISVTLGMNSEDHKGNVTAYIGYHRQEPVSQSERDFSGCLLVSTGTSFRCRNSSNSNILINADTGDTFGVLGSSFVPWGTPGTNPPQRFNSSPFQYLSRDDTRYIAGFLGHYDFNDMAKFYTELNFMDDRTTTQVAPTALFQQNGVFTLNCDNPLLSTQQATALNCVAGGGARLTTNVNVVIGRRNVEGGPRQSFYEHQSYRGVVGLRGDLSPVWSYDVYGQYYYATIEQLYLHDFNKEHIAKALQVVDRDPGPGVTPACKSALDGSDRLCVPWNIFSDGGVTQAVLGYVGAFGEAFGSTEQQIVSGNLNGDLGAYGVKSPFADDGVRIAVGAEYRREEATYTPDTLWQSGNLTGAGGSTPATRGHYDVSEVYGEARVPLAQGKPFIHDLAFDAGYRISDYSNAGRTDTYKAGLQWAPTADARVRGAYQRAVRAPNLTELFVPQYVTNSGVLTTDPCAGGAGAPAAATLAQCIRTGVTAAQYGNGTTTNTIIQCPAGQCSVEQGGNSALRPEKSDTITLGIILTPRAIPRLTASIDYYRIEQAENIGVIPITTVFNNCLNTGDPVFCARVKRTPQGYLFGDTIQGGGFVATPLENLAEVTNTGVDVQVNYALPTPEAWGEISVSLAGSYVGSAKIKTDPASPVYDCAGLFGPTCAAITPEWRHTMRVNWNAPWNVLLSAQWRHIGSSTLEGNSNQPVLKDEGTDIANGELKAVNYLDLSAIWDINDHFTLRGGLNNVFDKGPQIISGGDYSGVGGPNAYPNYDLLGRVFFVSATATF